MLPPVRVAGRATGRGQPGQQRQGAAVDHVIAPRQNNQSGANGVIVDAEGVLHSQVFVDPSGSSCASASRAAQAKLDRRVDQGQQAAQGVAQPVGSGHPANHREAAPADRRDAVPGRTDPGPLRLLSIPTRRTSSWPARPKVGRPICRAASSGWKRAGRCSNCKTWSWPCGRFRPAANRLAYICCSIDPTPEGLAQMQAFRQRQSVTAVRRRRRRIHRRRPAQQPRLSEHPRRRRVAQDAFRPGAGRGRLSHEADRHRDGKAGRSSWPATSIGPTGGQPQRPAALVLRARLSVRPRGRPTSWAWNWSATA